MRAGKGTIEVGTKFRGRALTRCANGRGACALLAAAAAGLIGGCATPAPESSFSWPSSGSTARARAPDERLPVPDPGTMGFEAWMQWVVTNHPRVRSAQARVAAARLAMEQAGTLPNPELGLKGSGYPLEEGDIRDMTGEIHLKQRIPLGGKLQAREQSAAAEIDLAASRLAEAIGMTRRDLAIAWVNLSTYREEAALAAGLAEAAAQARANALAQHEAGRLSLGDYAQAQLKAAETEAAVTEARSRAALAMIEFCSASGLHGGMTSIPDAVGLSLPGQIKPLAELPAVVAQAISVSHDVRRARCQLALAQADVAESRAAGWPDITVGGIYEHDWRGSRDRIGLTLELPLPLWSTNSKVASAARERVQAAAVELSQAEAEAAAQCRAWHEKLTSSMALYATYRDEVAPAAQRALTAVEASLEAGRAEIPDVLVARTALLSAKRGELAALRAARQAAAWIDWLTTVD